MNIKIISGGQTGADMGGLLAAKHLRIQTGGWAPKGWRTEDGNKEGVLKEFGLVEYFLDGYVGRTVANVLGSDVTIISATNQLSPGTRLTKLTCQKYHKPFVIVDPFTEFCAEQVKELLNPLIQKGKDLIINVAGNRESVSPGIEMQTMRMLLEVFSGQ